jgi:hypothetical protein
MNNSIDISLEGTEEQLSRLFSYTDDRKNSGLTTLATYIGHFFNKTLLRDGFYGAWAQVWWDQEKGTYNLKLSSPHHDLSLYQQLIPAFLDAGKTGVEIFQEIQPNIQEVISATKKEMRFLLPYGLAMANAKSIQLLHFPPLETFVYLDYLFSPSNRRWENLLGYNNYKDVNFPELESIVDCVPLAAPGADNVGIDPFNYTFTPYVKKMLRARLIPDGNSTQPVVACGGPVHEWLQNAFPDQIQGDLQTLSLVELRLFDNDVKTPVLCANHPSLYLYYTRQEYSEKKKEILVQDLIATGWQATMAFGTEKSAQEVLNAQKDYWYNSPDVKHIMDQEDLEFNYKY